MAIPSPLLKTSEISEITVLALFLLPLLLTLMLFPLLFYTHRHLCVSREQGGY
jgi:hypothetical protein